LATYLNNNVGNLCIEEGRGMFLIELQRREEQEENEEKVKKRIMSIE
jgi:hypothetical protein